MRIDGEWLHNPDTQRVCNMLTDAGHEALFVGGCVRNALIGVPVHDIDISTDARPQVVLDLAERAGLHAIPTGIEHGTITVVSNHVPHEITTFRKDVETDGRRAVVAFSDHVEDDAHRRDFTMNAIYATPLGDIVDPLGGIADLKSRRVRFIDDADLRIREDFLRILRYFRFHALYGDADQGMDPDALAAIAANSDGIETLSKERVGAEMLKLLAAPDPSPAIAAMRQSGVLVRVVSGADDRGLAPLVHHDAGLPRDPVRRLAVLGGQDVDQALRLSKKHARALSVFARGISDARGAGELGYRHGAEIAQGILCLRAALFETLLSADALDQAVVGAEAEFPLRPADLMPRFQGPALGAEIARLEDLWIQSGFCLDKNSLLSDGE